MPVPRLTLYNPRFPRYDSQECNTSIAWEQAEACPTLIHVQRDASTLSPMDLHEARGLSPFALQDTTTRRAFPDLTAKRAALQLPWSKKK